MSSQTPEIQNVLQRLNRLEKQNRRFKQAALVALALATAVVTIYATRPIPQVIQAHEFEVVDSAGRLRAKLGMGAPVPGELQEMVRKQTGFQEPPSPELYMETGYTQDGKRGVMRAVLTAGELSLSGVDPVNKMVTSSLDADSLLIVRPGGTVSIALPPQGPSVGLTDSAGYTMDLGSADTVIHATGQTQHTSADSIIMFGNDKEHHVIWQAP